MNLVDIQDWCYRHADSIFVLGKNGPLIPWWYRPQQRNLRPQFPTYRNALRNAENSPPNNTESHPRVFKSSQIQLWEPEARNAFKYVPWLEALAVLSSLSHSIQQICIMAQRVQIHTQGQLHSCLSLKNLWSLTPLWMGEFDENRSSVTWQRRNQSNSSLSLKLKNSPSSWSPLLYKNTFVQIG